jgi:DNA-binding MarR family transcriptional regulator
MPSRRSMNRHFETLSRMGSSEVTVPLARASDGKAPDISDVGRSARRVWLYAHLDHVLGANESSRTRRNRLGREAITEIAERAQLTEQTVVYLVNEFEALGYVERIQDVDDSRAKLLRPTARGRAAVIEARKAAAAMEREWANLVGVNRLRDLRNLLEQLHDALWPRRAEE